MRLLKNGIIAVALIIFPLGCRTLPNSGGITPIIEEIPHSPSAVELFSALKDRPYSFFLDSSLVDNKLGRFSLLGADPFLVFRSKKDRIALEWEDGRKEEFTGNPFKALKDIFKKYNIPGEERKAPFVGGGVGYFAYDLKDFVDHKLFPYFKKFKTEAENPDTIEYKIV